MAAAEGGWQSEEQSAPRRLGGWRGARGAALGGKPAGGRLPILYGMSSL